tara:strand:- start:129 stop:311 length:183 start_codon:yes stop_codon:yes gene_type:complete
MSRSDEREKVLKSACAKNYGAILSMAQVFNDAAFIVLTDLPVLPRLTTAKILLCFVRLCS